MAKKVKVYALSTCGWCRKTVQWLKDKGVRAEIVYTDRIEDPAERERITSEAREKAGKLSFPTVVVGEGGCECVITGYDPEEMRKKILE